MMKTLVKLLALALAVLLCLTGCSMITVDKEMDDAEIVATFEGGTITKGEAMEQYAETEAAYAQYGVTLSELDDVDSIKSEMLDYMIENKIVEMKAQELGLTELTDEEKAQLKEDAQAEYDEMVEVYKIYFEGETEEETDANVKEYLEQAGVTVEYLEEYYTENAWREKLKEHVAKDVSVTDEALQALYDQRVADDKEQYEGDSYSFEFAMTYGGSDVAWIPEGYRTVKHILLTYEEADQTKLDELQTKLDDVIFQIDDLTTPLSEDLEEDDFVEDEGTVDETIADEGTEAEAAEDVPADDAEADAATPSLEELQAQKTQLEQEIAAQKSASIEKMRATLDEIYARIEAGEDFDALIAEYGEDPGMAQEPASVDGYYVCENSETWEQAFTDGAMALEKVGDISEPVASDSGVHIIRYHSDVTGGAVPMEQMEGLEEEALEEAKQEAYDAQVAEWMAAANIEKHVEKIK